MVSRKKNCPIDVTKIKKGDAIAERRQKTADVRGAKSSSGMSFYATVPTRLQLPKVDELTMNTSSGGTNARIEIDGFVWFVGIIFVVVKKIHHFRVLYGT